MIKLPELNKSLGLLLTLSTIFSYGLIVYQLPYLNRLGGAIFFILSLALIPVLLIGLSVSLSQTRFEKFSANGFKVGAFFLLTILLYAIWEGPSYWLYSLILGVISGLLLYSLIKLSEPLSHLIFTIVGLIIVVMTILTCSMFVR